MPVVRFCGAAATSADGDRAKSMTVDLNSKGGLSTIVKCGELVGRINKIAHAQGRQAVYTEGRSHTKVVLGDLQTTIPRHGEVNENTARGILIPGRRTVKVTARATRSGDWWSVEVPEIPGLFTQARRLDQIPGMVRDAAQMLGHSDVDVTVVADLPEAQMAAVQEAKRRRQELRDVEAAAAKANRQAVAALRGSGLTVRDAAAVLGVSPQRISALDQPA